MAMQQRLAHLKFGRGFKVVLSHAHSQAAQMTLDPGDLEGGPDNRHRAADQWLFVVSGRGTALVNRKAYPLKAGSLLLIERGAPHEIRNEGSTSLKTLNIYVPPAYTQDGDELPRGKS